MAPSSLHLLSHSLLPSSSLWMIILKRILLLFQGRWTSKKSHSRSQSQLSFSTFYAWEWISCKDNSSISIGFESCSLCRLSISSTHPILSCSFASQTVVTPPQHNTESESDEHALISFSSLTFTGCHISQPEQILLSLTDCEKFSISDSIFDCAPIDDGQESYSTSDLSSSYPLPLPLPLPPTHLPILSHLIRLMRHPMQSTGPLNRAMLSSVHGCTLECLSFEAVETSVYVHSITLTQVLSP